MSEDIIRMAREAGFMPAHDNRVERFAALVESKAVAIERDRFNALLGDYRAVLETLEEMQAAVVAEREACAKVCEDIYNDPNDNNGYDCYYTRPYLECAAAIRARGQA